MANDEILTDDYVAGLLSQEATSCSIKYSAMGVDAFLPTNSKKPTNMPKPNTRFLRNIIRGTDTHNRALLAKEAVESKARLKRLERSEEIKRKKTNPTTRDIRNRHMGDIQAILGGGRRKRRDMEKEAAGAKDSETRGRDGGKHKSRSQKVEDSDEDPKRRKVSSTKEHNDESRENRSSQQDNCQARRSWHNGHSFGDETSSRRHRNSRDERSRSPKSARRPERRRSRGSERRRHRHHSPHRSPSLSPAKNHADDALTSLQDDFIGPAPPPVIRGRGAAGASSGIDRRFSASYDPKMDVQVDDDDNA